MRLTRSNAPQGRLSRASSSFIDRLPEAKAFEKALISHRRVLNDDSDEPHCRRNVLVFFGTGGIGKTELSQRLRSWVTRELPLDNGWGARPSTDVHATAALDLKDLAGQFDLLGSLISIRHALGALKPSWPAFDLAFAAYWTAARPSQPLPSQERDERIFAEAVSRTIADMLNDLGALATPVNLGLQSVRLIAREWQRRKTQNIAFDTVDNYEETLRACVDLPSPSDPRPDILVELAWLLAMDLSTGWERTPMVVVFIDTFERLCLDPRRTGESLLNKLIWHMPNVLFVVTGRSSLDWAEGYRSTLENSGSTVWPGLRLGESAEPRQHLVGKLSEQDRKRFINARRDALALPMSDFVVDQLAQASGGLPLYLDIALSVALSVMRNESREVTISDVTGSLDTLVQRVFEDMPEDEQRAVRAASLFGYFDPQLLAAAADIDQGSAERACRRTVIDRIESSEYPYRMHDEVRHAIRVSGHSGRLNWAPSDWQRAANRALQELRRRYEEAAATNAGAETLEALGLAVGLVCELEVEVAPSDSTTYSDWLAKAVVHGPSIAGLRQYVPAASKTSYGQRILDFIACRSLDIPLHDRKNLAAGVFRSAHPLSHSAGRHLAYMLRNNDEWQSAIAVFDELLAAAPSEIHRYQRALTVVNSRRFSDALLDIGALTPLRQDALLANIELSHGLPARWLARQPKELERQLERKAQREYLESLGDILRVRTIFVGDVEFSEAEKLLERAERVGHDGAIRECLLSLSLLSSTEDDRSSHAERLEALDRRANDGFMGFGTGLAKAYSAFETQNERELIDVAREMDKISARARGWIPVECLLNSLGIDFIQRDTQWTEPYDEVRNRWRGHFDRLSAATVKRRRLTGPT